MAEELTYEIKRVQFRSCEALYSQQFEDGAKRLPVDGINLDVGYIDTGSPADLAAEQGDDVPTVLCLHGAGGNHKDLTVVVRSLAARGARVIAPNFPGHGETAMDTAGLYSHTTVENCHFILDFLRALGIIRLDLIVAFSCGCYTAIPLAIKSGLHVNGLALLQVSGHRPYRAIQPIWLLKTTVMLLRPPLLRKIFSPILLLGGKLIGFKHISNLATPYTMAQVATGVPFDGYRRIASELPLHPIPMAVTFSEDDRYFDAAISYEFAHLIGLPKDQLTYIDVQGNVESARQPNETPARYISGVVFRKAGHYAQRKEKAAPTITKTVCDLYDHVRLNRAALNAALLASRLVESDFKHLK